MDEEVDLLCDKAKECLLKYYVRTCDDANIYIYGIVCPNLSPIEQIYKISYFATLTDMETTEDEIFGISLGDLFKEELQEQTPIKYNNKTYIADFVIDFSKKDKDGHFVYPKISDLIYVIELDGFEYHSNKQQMANDYEREQSIMELGYKVIRFTGSQIYNSAEDCVKKTISIIYKDIIKQITKGEHICRS